MLKLIVGLKGSGKTKTLIEMVNSALDTTKGNVVCIEKGKKLRYDIKYQCRLVEADEYLIDDAQSLYGFVAGIVASDHDLTDLFIDGALKIGRDDLAAFEVFVAELAKLLADAPINCVVTASVDPAQLSDFAKQYVIVHN